jgi:ATPase subunit of ABC transporter with duplicated ATPase domains
VQQEKDEEEERCQEECDTQEQRHKDEYNAWLASQQAQQRVENQRQERRFQAQKQQKQLEAAATNKELTSQMYGPAQAYYNNLLPSICSYVMSISDSLPVKFKEYRNVAVTGDVSVGKSSLLRTSRQKAISTESQVSIRPHHHDIRKRLPVWKGCVQVVVYAGSKY